MKPTLGRVVYYVDEMNKVFAAIITQVNEKDCRLFVLDEKNPYFVSATESKKLAMKCWSWPPVEGGLKLKES